MTVLFSCDQRFGAHDTGPGHPERPARLTAVESGLRTHHLNEMTLSSGVRPASDAELEAVHPASHVATVERFSAEGGGYLDADTVVSSRSAELARLGSGTFLHAVEQLRQGVGAAAFVAVRPPGHHATSDVAMGFCLYNHVAVAAANLRAGGERVAVVDFDAHHGNGTQEIFWDEPGVMYVSWHQSPHYPHTGRAEECGGPDALGATLNVPLPAGVTGEHYRRSIDELVGPELEAFEPDWLLVSAGFDGHRADPLCDLSLSSGDISDVMSDLVGVVPRGRVAAVLEGGYDLGAIADCSAALVAALGGVTVHPEPPTSGGPGGKFVDSAIERRRRVLGR